MNAQSFPERASASPLPEHHHDQIFIPRPIVYAVIALIAFVVVTVALGRVFQVGVTHEGTLHPDRVVTFRVAGANGGALVATRSDGLVVPLARAGEEIFPRLILRSVGNIRMREGVPLSAPLELALMPDGERLIVDPATRRTVRLAAFGPDNGAVLDPLLATGARR